MRILPVNNNTNVITIEKNIPMPLTKTRSDVDVKYSFLHKMEVGDSFSINGSTPDFSTTGVRAFVYGQNASKIKSNRYTVRTITGPSINPTSIRVWRIK